MISKKKACEKIIKLSEQNSKLRKTSKKNRETASSQKQLEIENTKLQKTFQLWPIDAEKLIKNEEDRKFLESMKTVRVATFGSGDKKLESQKKRRAAREEQESKRRKKQDVEECTKSQAATSSEVSAIISSTSASGSSEESDDHFRPAAYIPDSSQPSTSTGITHSSRKKIGTKAFITPDILESKKQTSLATRMKMTPAQQAAYTKAVVEEAGGDPEKVNLSYASADRARRKIADDLAFSHKQDWIPPSATSLHLDSKMAGKMQNPNEKEERLTVAVGNKKEVKLLGVPSYTPGSGLKSGEIISSLTVNLLQSWKCSEVVVNMVFDTTASNTGHLSAACVAVQDELGRPLLWSACRHHIGEVILTHVFNDLKIETSKSPEVMVFARFRKTYSLIPQDFEDSESLNILNISDYSDECKDLIENWQKNVIEILTDIDEKQQPRDDYKELLDLTLVFLGGKKLKNFRRPGALHKARWMAKLIYALKICLMEKSISKLKSGTVTTKPQMRKLRDFVIFSVLLYVPWCFLCNSVVNSPWNDLKLYKDLLSYEGVNALVSRSARKAFDRHLWYVTSEMVVLALFSSNTPEAEKKLLGDTLKQIESVSGDSKEQPQKDMEKGLVNLTFPKT